MNRVLLMLCLLLAGLAGLAGPGATHAAGNTDAAHACQQGGYLTLFRSDGTGFANAGECTSYAARGGAFSSGIPSCSVVPGTSGCVTLDNLTITGSDASLGTISLTGAYSFSPVTTCGPYYTSPTVPCGTATGGGTYTVTGGTFNGGTGGTFTVTGTWGAEFALDSTGAPTTCAQATTGYQLVIVVATFTDTATGQATQSLLGVIKVPNDSPSWAGAAAYSQQYSSAVPPGVTVAC